MYDNAYIGIDLDGNGVTDNDLDDSDTGPNEFQNYPDIQRAFYRPGNNVIAIEFSVSSDDTVVDYPLTIDAYLAADADKW